MSMQDFSANPNKASFASGVIPEWGYWKISNLEGIWKTKVLVGDFN